MCLPKYCWICCFNCSVDSGAKFFSIFRLIVAISQILSILESLIATRVQLELENALHNPQIKNSLNRLGFGDDELQDGSDIGEEIKNMIFMFAMLLLSCSLLYSIIEIIVASLAIHGMRRARPNMLLPYIIWTSFLALIAFAFVALLVVAFVFVMIYINEINGSANMNGEQVPVSVVIVIFVILGIMFGLMFAWILWDLLIMSSRHRQLKNSIGMDHIMLQECANDEKEKMLYPQLT